MAELTVILADDHEIFRKGLEVVLKRIPVIGKIYHAGNGHEVLHHLEAGISPDLIIMDIRMPQLNGVDATREIRKHNKRVKIIALSMMNDRSSIVEMFKAGSNGYLLKNTNRQELSEAIENVINGNTYYAREVSEVLLSNELFDNVESEKSHPKVELTIRETEILKLICHQYSSREIAEILFLSEKTVEGHRSNLMEKTQSRNLAGLVFYALQNEIIRTGGQD